MGRHSRCERHLAVPPVFPLAAVLFPGPRQLFGSAISHSSKGAGYGGTTAMTRPILRAAAALSLLICLAAPFLYFWQSITESSYRNLLAAGSISWFVFATWAGSRTRN